ncbi:MAG: hypothetical protein IIA73_04625 [Proteobacteria bacterium]|nr:hypothetical protein [Pseudomonadota bacterium]
MGRKLTLIVTTVVIALCLGLGAPAWAEEAAPYPVWWSPKLGLESLDLIDSELQEAFPRGQQFHLVKYDLKRVYIDELIDETRPELGYNWDIERVNVVEHWIEDCRSLIKWTDEGFHIDQDNPYWIHADTMHAIHSARCYALMALKRAKPAEASFVRDFVFDEDAMNYIPPMIGMGWDCKNLYKFLRANRGGVSWSDFDYGYFDDQTPVYKLIVMDDTTLIVDRIVKSKYLNTEYVYSTVRMIIYGRGDFDGDGLDDLLIRWEAWVPPSHGDPVISSSVVYVATRQTPDGVLRVVDLVGPSPTDALVRCNARTSIVESGRIQ